jgi:hypothetical protein
MLQALAKSPYNSSLSKTGPTAYQNYEWKISENICGKALNQ